LTFKAKFEVEFLQPAVSFLEKLDSKVRKKIIYNIDKSRYMNDPRLFKKLENEIWEFRTNFGNTQYRLLAFWDKQESGDTLVIATHGFIKKVSKVPKKEIDKALALRKKYFNEQ
jgi:phage-related protein